VTLAAGLARVFLSC